ncbi:MAG: hypothetical protein HN350_16955 [Phycisphaerales bacterium]|jgi:predicted GH43/DUF377 family glycosyl hydrolase|nr:hypothetical protein [Phycisphaerales bacterium]
MIASQTKQIGCGGALGTKSLKARKIEGYLTEPLISDSHWQWEGHHATNPTVLRLNGDPRVFLGYRAGGLDDHHYHKGATSAMGSHFGMAILDELGEKVLHRLPFPIMTLRHGIALPKNREEYEQYAEEHEHEIVLLHDFHMHCDDGHLYVLYHESEIHAAYDCIVRMTESGFLARIQRSIELLDKPIDEIYEAWEDIWWKPGVWEDCGTGDSHRIYASEASKNDIFFLRLADKTLRMYHRPAPDIAVLDTGNETFTRPTPDGITAIGSLQTCIRPGFFDNSHIGNNGAPIRAKIGDVDVYLDVTHGVHNEQISNPNIDSWMMTYLPFLRIIDFETGECLYYSEEPILDLDEIWREYVEEGTWVKKLNHLRGVMFAGGQIESVQGKNGLDDMFSVYVGLGDTSIGRAEFKLRDLLPDRVVEDIINRKARRDVVIDNPSCAAWGFPEALCGWQWTIVNDIEGHCINIIRTLRKDGHTEGAVRVIPPAPGTFDADGLFFEEDCVRFVENLGWVVVYRGVHWEEDQYGKRTFVGYGVLVLDSENPERVLYRSTEPINDKVTRETGWTGGHDNGQAWVFLEHAEAAIPDKVKFEIARIYDIKPMPSDLTKWLKHKSGRL